jgi:cell division protease FtsH
MAYGGRAAEEIVFGHNRVTTGAASDIQQATSIARRYVTQWGLSDTIGPILVGDVEQELFLGRDIQTRREVSEQTAQLVDSEVKRVAFEAHARAVAVLTEHRALLDIVATQLLERETLTRDDILLLKAGKELPPRMPDMPSAPPSLAAPSVPAPRPVTPPLLGGPEIAPA